MRTHDPRSSGVGRRTFLKGVGATATAGALAAGGSPVRAAASEPSLEEWFANVDNYDGVANKTGLSEVTVEVGVQANQGAFGYGPAAIRVDPGTTVVWEWTGGGGSHDVAAVDDSFASELLGDAGATFEHAFEDEGTTLYSCTPHEAMGMKGAVVVGDADVGAAESETPEPDYGDWLDDVDNYESTVDARGTDEVRVAVGAEGNGGHLAFDPPAVRVDPGTTVVWEWIGDGGPHGISDADHGFAADPSADEGHTYALQFDGVGISKYGCDGHLDAGMKGAVVVGEPGTGDVHVDGTGLAVSGAVLAAVLSPLAFLAFLAARGIGEERPDAGVEHRPASVDARGDGSGGDESRVDGPRADGWSRRTLRRVDDDE